ncbi:MAG: VOC family protein [Gemmatimonadaceae bacterium]|jgi:catechol 2,3-dioxygenase
MTSTGDLATAGSYGEAPSGYRLPDATHVGAVTLQVASLERSVQYYTQVLGMHVAHRAGATVQLTPHGDDRVLVVLHEQRGARPVDRRGRLGLYHFALLLPSRSDLGRFVAHLAAIGARAASGDHWVSEALYLTDPDGLGIEVYADRPREAWRRSGRELLMATDPVDLHALVQAAGETRWAGMPAGTVMGHVHLHVGDLAGAQAFYSEALGLDRMVWRYPGALFLAAGGYHHHLGTNVWAGPTAAPAPADEARLLHWALDLPSRADLEAVQASLAAAGYPAELAVAPDGTATVTTQDPWGTRLVVRVAGR